jgi:hypothetical protein
MSRWQAGVEVLYTMARWVRGERTVRFLVERERLESFEAQDLSASAQALIGRATLRVATTAVAALDGGDVDGAYVAAYDAYRMRRRIAHDGRGRRVSSIR